MVQKVDPDRPVFGVFGAEVYDQSGVKALHSALADFPMQAPVVVLSSSSVYGDRDFGLNLRSATPSDESHGLVITSPLDPGAIRPLTALTFEHLFVQREVGRTLVVRPFNVYGPGITQGVIPRFIQAVKEDRPLEVHAPGRQTRTFLFVEDFLQAFDVLLNRLLRGGRGIYNVGSEEQVELLSLAKSVCHAFDKVKSFAIVETSERHVWWKLPAIDRVRADGRWRATTSLRSGLFRLAGR
jgi:nucleoside-diphosphate-sugar epimerase